jgi:hypothetical protein
MKCFSKLLLPFTPAIERPPDCVKGHQQERDHPNTGSPHLNIDPAPYHEKSQRDRNTFYDWGDFEIRHILTILSLDLGSSGISLANPQRFPESV